MSEQPHPPEHERPGYLCWCGTVHQRGDGLWTGGDHVKRSTIIMIVVAVLALTLFGGRLLLVQLHRGGRTLRRPDDHPPRPAVDHGLRVGGSASSSHGHNVADRAAMPGRLPAGQPRRAVRRAARSLLGRRRQLGMTTAVIRGRVQRQG